MGVGSGEFYHIGVGMGCGNGAAFCGLPEHVFIPLVRHRIRPRGKKRRFCPYIFRMRRSPAGLLPAVWWTSASGLEPPGKEPGSIGPSENGAPFLCLRVRTRGSGPCSALGLAVYVGAGSFSAPSRPTGASTPRHRGRRIPHALTGALDSVLQGTERETDSGPTPRPVCRGAPPNQASRLGRPPIPAWPFSTEVLRPVEGGERSSPDREPLATGGRHWRQALW